MIPQQSEEERMKVRQLCHDLATTFSTDSGKSEKLNALQMKHKRYIEHRERDLVRVEDQNSVFFDQWISRTQAVDKNLKFYDPVIWLDGFHNRKKKR